MRCVIKELYLNLKTFLQSTLIKSKSLGPGFTLNNQQFEMKEASRLVKFNPQKFSVFPLKKYKRNVSSRCFFSANNAFVKGSY